MTNGEINMQVDVDSVNELDKGWMVRLNVNLSSEELSKLNQKAINRHEDFDIFLDGSKLYFNCFLNKDEPWEDEPLEELLKAIKIEVKYRAQALLE